MNRMAWDSTRIVPWQRLVREWLIYVGVMAIILVVFFRDSGVIGALAGLLVSGPLYLFFGFVMAKFGYQRRTLKGLNTPRAASGSGSGEDDQAASVSSKSSTSGNRQPLPTKRTSGGANRPAPKPRRR
jgi:hypothetical protein